MPPFIEFLRAFNADVVKTTGDSASQVSVFGMDLYSLHRSAEEVVRYLEKVDPQAAKDAKSR